MVYSTRRFVLYLTLWYSVLVFSFHLALRLPRLGKRELILVFFIRLFDLCFFFFWRGGGGGGGVGVSLLLVVWEGLRFVLMALPGLFSYPILFICGVCVSIFVAHLFFLVSGRALLLDFGNPAYRTYIFQWM